MTDTTTQFNDIVAKVRRFVEDLEWLHTISDRIGSDSASATNLADAALRAGRKDLTIADFDNLKICIDHLAALLAASDKSTVPVSVNTGGSLKLGFYKII